MAPTAKATKTTEFLGLVSFALSLMVLISVATYNPADPVPFFKATVSCLGPEGVVNVSTSNFPTSSAGNAHIQAVIDLPRPCKQPIIFVVAPTGQWFAESNPDTQP